MSLHYLRHPTLNNNRWTLVHKVGDNLIDSEEYNTLPFSFYEANVYAPHIPVTPDENNSYFWKTINGEGGTERILYRALCVLYNETEDVVRCTMMRVRDGYISHPSQAQLNNFIPASSDEVDDFVLNNNVQWCTEASNNRKRQALASVNRADRDLSIYSATLSLVNRLAALTQPEPEEDVIPTPTPAPSGLRRGESVASNFTETSGGAFRTSQTAQTILSGEGTDTAHDGDNEDAW